MESREERVRRYSANVAMLLFACVVGWLIVVRVDRLDVPNWVKGTFGFIVLCVLIPNWKSAPRERDE